MLFGGIFSHRTASQSDGDRHMDAWRKNGTCSACTHFIVDFGEEPEFFGHCKMYQRVGSRDANDATCHQFQPAEGFEEKVVLEVRTTVPDSSRQRTAPGRTIVGHSAPVVRRRDGEDARGGEHTSYADEETDDDANPESIATFLDNPGGGLDPAVLDLALLDLVERYGLVESVPLDRELRGGMLVLQPADRGLKAAEIEIDALFHKIVMVRDRMRLVEQKVNSANGLSDLQKVDLQYFITRSYGAMSAFSNIFRKTSGYWNLRRATRRSLENLLRRFDDVRRLELAPKWTGGEVTALDSDGDVIVTFPLELIFERTCRLKQVLEELASAADAQGSLDTSERAAIADYISKSQGSLTTLNIVFRHSEDKFSSK